MRFLKLMSLTVISLALLSLPGCMQHYSVYGFKTAEKKFGWGAVGARLIGSRASYYVKVLVGSPYELFVWFEPENFMEGSVQITKLKLINAQTKQIFFEKNEVIEEFFRENDQLASFSFDNIDLEYVDFELQIEFLLKHGDRSTEYKTQVFLEKKYEEYFTMVSH